MTAFVYILAVGGEDGPFRAPVKIGLTSNPDKRLASIRPHSPLGVSFAFLHQAKDRGLAQRIERAMHGHFSGRLIQHEWFDVDPGEAIEALQTISSGVRQ